MSETISMSIRAIYGFAAQHWPAYDATHNRLVLSHQNISPHYTVHDTISIFYIKYINILYQFNTFHWVHIIAIYIIEYITSDLHHIVIIVVHHSNHRYYHHNHYHCMDAIYCQYHN